MSIYYNSVFRINNCEEMTVAENANEVHNGVRCPGYYPGGNEADDDLRDLQLHIGLIGDNGYYK